MKEILITSSVLIAVILLMRWLFRGKVSQRLIYGAWLLVALRLLIPIQFGQFQYSVTGLTDQIESHSAPIRQAQEALDTPIAGPSRDELYQQLLNEYIQQNTEPITPQVQEQIKIEAAEQVAAPTVAQILTNLWIAGMVVMALWFLVANIRFLHRAKIGTEPFPCEVAARVRLSSNVSSPCLVGLFRPVIYLTPASIESPQSLTHVLTHETTHLRHGDHIWSLVRCICLCIYWFNPLVWVAAILSKRDCELACDESALKKLGDSERIPYGRTLLAVVSHANSPTHLIETATAMSETKKQLKERVNFIVKKPRNLIIAAISLILVIAIAAGCTFTGSKVADLEPTVPPATEPSASTEPSQSLPTAEEKALAIAKERIAQYEKHRGAGLCCDLELIDKDMSQYLTDDQKVGYSNQQYQITCCQTMSQVREHILRTYPAAVAMDAPEKQIFTGDEGCLYLLPTHHPGVTYEDIALIQYSDSRIVASAVVYDIWGQHYSNQVYSIEDTGNGFVIQDMDWFHLDIDTIPVSDEELENRRLRTITWSKERLGLSYVEFLYWSNDIVLSVAKDYTPQVAEETIRNTKAVAHRSLLELNRTLMLSFPLLSIGTDDTALSGYFAREITPPDQDIEAEAYRWFFGELGQTPDSAYAGMLLDAVFQSPDLFLKYAAEYDAETIQRISASLHSGIASQTEYDLYTQLLLAISAQTDLTAAEEQALAILAEAPNDFPYEATP